MKFILVILNGIRLHYHVIDYAIQWAKNNSGSVHALFLKSSKETSPGYAFPSDLSLSETVTDKEEAKEDDETMISTNMQLVKEMVQMKDIPYKSELKIDARLNDVLAVSENASIIIVAEDFDDESAPLTKDRVSLKRLRNKARCPVEVVSPSKTS